MTAALVDQFWTHLSPPPSLSLSPSFAPSCINSRRHAAFSSQSPKKHDRFGLEMNSLGTIQATILHVESVSLCGCDSVRNEQLEKPQYLICTMADSRKARDLLATGISHWRQTTAQRNKQERRRQRVCAWQKEREEKTTDMPVLKKKRSTLLRRPVKCQTPSQL